MFSHWRTQVPRLPIIQPKSVFFATRSRTQSELYDRKALPLSALILPCMHVYASGKQKLKQGPGDGWMLMGIWRMCPQHSTSVRDGRLRDGVMAGSPAHQWQTRVGDMSPSAENMTTGIDKDRRNRN